MPLWPLPLLRSQAGFSSECSVEQIVDKSQMGGRMDKQEEITGGYLMQKSGTQFQKQRFLRKKETVCSCETAHILHMMWKLHRRMEDLFPPNLPRSCLWVKEIRLKKYLPYLE